jgi:chromosomal replication initiation ATPase DnaA
VTSPLNAQSRFETFVVGASNRLAVTAAKAVAESPGSIYNPLFMYARPGLGKTHLLMAAGHGARAVNPRASAEYLTVDDFVETYHAAIAQGQGDAYRRRFLDVDVLLVDDVQFLAERREVQAELLRLVDALQRAGRQIVLASDRPPSEIENLDERLIRRFAGGLVIDIAAPDYETRVAILRRRAEERRVAFTEGVLEAVAHLPIDNVRELIGALNRLIAFQAVSSTPLDVAQARLLVGGATAHVEAERPAIATSRTGDAAAREPRADAPDTAVAVESDEPSPAMTPPARRAPDPVAEFDDFLSDIAVTLSQQVEAWRQRVGEAVVRWDGEGFRTARLVSFLDGEAPVDPEAALRVYEADIARLLVLQEEVTQLAPELAGSPALRDPDDIPSAEAVVERAREGSYPPVAPSQQWQLDDLVEGASTRMSVRAARAAAAEPGTKYNPLVITGTSGVGKTHLLHGLGNALVAVVQGPVACLSAHEFTDELITAIDRDEVARWRARYRRVGALLLDDVHLIAGKDRTQDELFWLFNHLLEHGRQMAFTSAVPLAQLAGVEARLLTRLEGGLVVDLPAPDREVRQRIVERLLEGAGADPELIAYLAARPGDSARSVQGLVQRVQAAAEAQGRPLSAGLARDVLEGVTPRPLRAPAAPRASGVVLGPAGGIRSREKMVWDWPDLGERTLEDWR